MTTEKRFKRMIDADKKNAAMPGPSNYNNFIPHTTIEGSINASHRIVAVPLLGFPHPKDSTYHLFDGNCVMRDETFACLAVKNKLSRSKSGIKSNRS